MYAVFACKTYCSGFFSSLSLLQKIYRQVCKHKTRILDIPCEYISGINCIANIVATYVRF